MFLLDQLSAGPPLPIDSNPTSSLKQPHVSNSPVSILDNLPYGTCKKIYEAFDTDSDLMNWRQLAAWLGLKVKDVKRIEGMGSKFTQNVIQTWETQAGNDIDKFINILREENMTKLADEMEAVK